MSANNLDFKSRYHVNLDDNEEKAVSDIEISDFEKKVISDFEDASKFSFSKKEKEYMYQFMATVGLELESRFPNAVNFDNNDFLLFGREKSKKSTDAKKKNNIKDFKKALKEAFDKGVTAEELPSKVRPIFDFYAFKLVCPEIENPQEIINTVLVDILTDISERHPEHSSNVTDLIESLKSPTVDPVEQDVDSIEQDVDPVEQAVDLIEQDFNEDYPYIKSTVSAILKEQENVKKTQKFIESVKLILNSDMQNLTYTDYYSILSNHYFGIIGCYQELIALSYEESTDEHNRIAQSKINIGDEYDDFVNQTKNLNLNTQDQQFSEKLQELLEGYNNKLQELADHISRKKTNKLDLELGNLMLLDVLYTSKQIRNLGINVSKDPTRTKKKRNSNGYIADFYSLDMPNGLTAEIQLQSLYRYIDGESGYSAHNKMGNGTKKRILVKMPEEESEYANWAKEQFVSLPKYFKYIGHGFVEVYNTLKNFRRFYDTESQEEVETYIKYIAHHDIDQLDSSTLHFTLDDESSLSKEMSEHSIDSAPSIEDDEAR